VIVKENACVPTGGVGEVEIPASWGAVPPDTVRICPLDGGPAGPFWTETVKLPAARVVEPFNCVAVLLDKAELATAQGVQPGPLNVTRALDGSKPVPVIVNVNAWPLTGGFGVVVSVVNCGPLPLALETESVTPLEGVPLEPFWTVTVKLPAASVAVPVKIADDLLASALLAMLHGVQPGPLNNTSTLVGSKADPEIANENDWPPTGGFGVVAIVASCGAAAPALETVRETPLEGVPADPFCTVTV